MRGVRGERNLMIAVTVPTIVLASTVPFIPLLFFHPPGFGSILITFCLALLCHGPMIAFLIWRAKHINRVYSAADGRICPECGQSLVGLGDEGTCTAFEIADIRRRWRSVVHEKTPRRMDAP